MNSMFYFSKVNTDLNKWKPLNLSFIDQTFFESKNNIPYWANYKDLETRIMAIKSYHLENGIVKELNEELNKTDASNKKLKI